MNKRFRSILCSLLALIMLLTLLPMTVAAADPKTEAYNAYAAFLNARIADIGKPVWDEDFYNFINSNKRDAKLAEIKGVAFAELTNDGINEMIIRYEAEYDFTAWSVPRSQFWTCIYTYNNGKVTLIGQNPLWMLKKDENTWVATEPPGYVMSGDWYLCTGNDGTHYITHRNPSYITDLTFFYGFDGTMMQQAVEFNAVFIPEWEIKLNGFEIESPYGTYYCYVDDVRVNQATLNATLSRYTGSGVEKINYSDAETALSTLQMETSNPFTDVAPGDWFAKPVLWAVDNNVTGGIGNGMFGPNNPCTRAQVVTFLWAANGKPEPTSSNNPFTDVPGDAWYLKPVLWAVERGITGGTSPTTFSPDAECTRAQIVTFLYAAAGKPSMSGGNPFQDVSRDDWYFPPILWAKETGITGGTSPTTFGPLNVCTRGQVVTFLYKAYDGGIIKPEIKPEGKPTPTPVPTPAPERTEQVSAAQSYTSAKGPSAAQALWKLSDGSYQTDDGRLTAALGEAMAIRNGEVLKGSGATWKMSKQNTFQLSKYHGSDLLQFHAPNGELITNQLYQADDMTDDDAYYMTLKTDGATYSSEAKSEDFSAASVRLMHVSSTEVVLYVYAEAPGETIEALICAKR